MTTASIKSGESLNIGLYFKDDYQLPSTCNLIVYIGGVCVGNLFTQKPIIEKIDNKYSIKISSSDTFRMRGYRDLIVVLDDPDGIGNKKTIVGGISFDRLSDEFVSDSKGNLYNILIGMDVSTSTYSGNVEIVNFLKGEKGNQGDIGLTGPIGPIGPKGEEGNSGVYIGIEEPTDPDVNVWINPLGNSDSNIYMINISYNDLVTLRNTSKLSPGAQYRIIDYITTTTQENTRALSNVFDIIVVADSVNTLNENARAIHRNSTTYFSKSRLSAWKLKYCLDNDTNFIWADTINGKGVIYFMEDEWGNECPYDFKNIQYNISGTYYYTFNTFVDPYNYDSSINYDFQSGNKYSIVCYGNKIKKYLSMDDYFPKQKLNKIVFKNLSLYFYSLCFENLFDENCYSNIFGDNCSCNIFEGYCNNNTLGAGSGYNVFKLRAHNNNLVGSCVFNSFGENSNNNSLNNSRTNFFEKSCSYINLGSGCTDNTFGNGCASISLGSNSQYNRFGNSCFGIELNKNFYYNTFGAHCTFLKSLNTESILVKHINIENGTNGVDTNNKLDIYDSNMLNKEYQITFKKSSTGRVLMLWSNDNGVLAGRYKTDNTDTVWKDIIA